MAICNSIISTIPWIGAFIILIVPFLLLAINLSIFNRSEFYPLLPFVSDLGIKPPCSSMLSMFLCFTSILFVLFLLFRYKFTRELLKEWPDHPHPTFPFYSLITFTLVTTGSALIGSFRNVESKFTQIIHSMAALMTFSIYLVDVYLEMEIAESIPSQRFILKIRRFIFYFGSLFSLLFLPTAVASFVSYPKSFFNETLRLAWSPEDPGWLCHVISTFCEWMIILSVPLFLLTYVPMFNKKKVSKNQSDSGSHRSANSTKSENPRV